MAKREIFESDLTQQVIPDDERMVMTVLEHPDIEAPVLQDVAASDVENLGKLSLKNVDVVEVRDLSDPDKDPARYILTASNLGKLAAEGVDMDEVLKYARPAGTQRMAAPGRERGGVVLAAVDYTSPENAGRLHRGKVTDKEADWVRNNLELANKNRAAAGQPPINPNDPADQKRYGFPATGQLPTA